MTLAVPRAASYFKDKPEKNFKSIIGTVKTASNQSVESLGVGEVKLGKLHVKNVVYVPGFNHNLLSGIVIMKSGYIQIIKNDHLEIQDNDGNVMCTGKYNPDFGLIEIIQDFNTYKCHQSSQDLQTWHRKLAHINNDTLKRSLKQYGINTNGNLSSCDDCIKGKMTASNSKVPSKKTRDVLELIESDTTPFPSVSHDGFSYNIKFVDASSGDIFLMWIDNLKSSTSLECFRLFEERVENLTNKSIIILRTDGGTEYKGTFLDYLRSSGIIKQTGQAHRKHFPPRAERSHRTILNLARSSHESSKLPIKFFSEAHRYAAYTYNRLIHNESMGISPYEAIH